MDIDYIIILDPVDHSAAAAAGVHRVYGQCKAFPGQGVDKKQLQN